MTMYDQEFDREMREKFESYQPEPSAGLWDKIATRLDAASDGDGALVSLPSKPKRQSAWWWSAAAGILLLGAFAWWQYQPVEVMYLRGNPRVTASSDASETLENPPLQTREANSRAEVSDRPVSTVTRVAERSHSKLIAHTPSPPADVFVSNESVVNETTTNPSGIQEVAVIPPAGAELGAELLIDTTHHASPLSQGVYASAVDAVVIPVELGLESTEQRPVERGFGVSSLLNMVVGSVDPREEKLITFSDDDEGLIKMAVNLGRNRVRRSSE